MADGEVVFSIRADDSNIETDLQSALDKISSAVESISEIAGSIDSAFSSSFDKVSLYISDKFLTEWCSLWESAAEAVGSAFDTISAKVASSCNDINASVSSIMGLASSASFSASAGNSFSAPVSRFRTGLDYVPSDDFPALLHRGEAVLTSSEADLYRSVGGLNGLSSITDGSFVSDLSSAIADLSSALSDSSRDVNVTQNNYSPSALSAYDVEKAARELAQSLSERL